MEGCSWHRSLLPLLKEWIDIQKTSLLKTGQGSLIISVHKGARCYNGISLGRLENRLYTGPLLSPECSGSKALKMTFFVFFWTNIVLKWMNHGGEKNKSQVKMQE